MGLQETVAALKKRGDEARTRHARALAGMEQAAGRAAQLSAMLQREFGVSTVDEAKALRGQLCAEAETEAAEVTRLLGEAGGTA